MNRLFMYLATISLTCLLTAGLCAEDAPKVEEKAPPPAAKEALEKKFVEALSGATLTGHFTDQSKPDAKLPREEKYTIESVSKLHGDYWLFKSRIQYGTHDATLPLPLRVLWAGETPVITLDKVPVPGFGTFSARVMIHDGKYAGTWDGGDHGGLLFGTVAKDKK